MMSFKSILKFFKKNHTENLMTEETKNNIRNIVRKKNLSYYHEKSHYIKQFQISHLTNLSNNGENNKYLYKLKISDFYEIDIFLYSEEKELSEVLTKALEYTLTNIVRMDYQSLTVGNSENIQDYENPEGHLAFIEITEKYAEISFCYFGNVYNSSWNAFFEKKLNSYEWKFIEIG